MKEVESFLEEQVNAMFFEAAPKETVTNQQVADALNLAKKEAKDAAAQAYLKALPQAADEYGKEGVLVQLLYVMNNLSTWRGENAKAAKATIKAFLKQHGKMR
jgi:hypothetical protein